MYFHSILLESFFFFLVSLPVPPDIAFQKLSIHLILCQLMLLLFFSMMPFAFFTTVIFSIHMMHSFHSFFPSIWCIQFTLSSCHLSILLFEEHCLSPLCRHFQFCLFLSFLVFILKLTSLPLACLSSFTCLHIILHDRSYYFLILQHSGR